MPETFPNMTLQRAISYFLYFFRFNVQNTFVGDKGELERALDDVYGTGVTVRSCCEKRFEKKTLQKLLKVSDCRKSIRKQIRPSCRKPFRLLFVFVWFRESKQI